MPYVRVRNHIADAGLSGRCEVREDSSCNRTILSVGPCGGQDTIDRVSTKKYIIIVCFYIYQMMRILCVLQRFSTFLYSRTTSTRFENVYVSSDLFLFLLVNNVYVYVMCIDSYNKGGFLRVPHRLRSAGIFSIILYCIVCARTRNDSRRMSNVQVSRAFHIIM